MPNPLFWLSFTRQRYISYSGLQAGAGTRRSARAKLIPLPGSPQRIHALATLGYPVQRAGTQVRRLPETPDPLILKDRPRRADPQTALPHLATGWLQRRWGALLRTGTPRLNTLYIVAGLITTLVLAGCSSSSIKETPPAELHPLEKPIPLRTLWQGEVDDGTQEQALQLVPAAADGRVYAAARSGLVRAFDATSGKIVWSVETDALLAGGPGVGDGLVLLGTSTAEVIALNGENGEQRWRTKVSSEVLSVPATAEGLVVVHCSDGQVFALDSADGKIKWTYQRNLPLLTLHGVGSPVISNGAAIVGFAGGKLVSLDLTDGSPRWESTITLPRGRTELERMADLDSRPVVRDGVIYVAVFQGDVAAVAEENGHVLWRRPLSSHVGLAADWRYLYVVDDDDNIWALDPTNGAALWKQKKLNHRTLSPPTVVDDTLIVGDFEGYLHWLTTEEGRLIGRIRIGSGPIHQAVQPADGVLYVYNDDGTVAAVSAAPPDSQ